MSRLKFVKMAATGNDFVVVDFRIKYQVSGIRYSKLARYLCQRKTGIGADGVLVIEKSKRADFKMRIFNPDGSEPEMCGNGLRCAALYVHKKNMNIETKAGVYKAIVTGRDKVKIKMEGPRDLKRSFSPSGFRMSPRGRIKGKTPRGLNYIDTGVPHTVIFVEGLDKIDVESIGSSLRYHKRFRPRGTNVDFVEIIDDKNIKMRTYERGVEAETLACGTGAVASAIVSQSIVHSPQSIVNVHARGGILKVYFKNTGGRIKDVYLEGEAREVFRGEFSIEHSA